MLCAKFSWNWLIGSLNFVNVSSRFRKYLPLEKGVALYLNKFESPSLKDVLAHWFWRRRFLNFVNCFPLFRNCVPLEKWVALHLNRLEFQSPKDVLCQIWLRFNPLVLDKIFKFRQCIFAISLLCPLGKGRCPSFEETRIPFIQGCLLLSLVEIGPVVLEN